MKDRVQLVDSSLLFGVFCLETSNSGEIYESVSGVQTKPELIFAWSKI